MRKLAVALFLGILLPGCGSDSGTPVNNTPPPTPTPAPNFTGRYSGISTFNVAGQAEIRPPTVVSVTHNGGTITFSDMVVTIGTQAVVYPLGSASESGSSFLGTHSYQSAGCGPVAVTTNARFAGNLMNIQAIITPLSCAQSRIVAELSR